MPLRRVHEPSQKPRYYHYLLEMMTYLFPEREYEAGHEFSAEELGVLTPEHVYRWMAHKVYGLEEPGPDDKPIGRSTSLNYYKKAISYFMPNRLMPWNEIAKVGNPTRSTIISDLQRSTIRLETRRQGITSKADRALLAGEFQQVMDMLDAYEDFNRKYQFPCIFKFQFHLIARLDDACRLKKVNMKGSDMFDFIFLTKLNWSKNVHEERDCPYQVNIASMDSRYCVQLSMALYLETWLEGDGKDSEYVFVNVGTYPEHAKRNSYNCLKEIINSEDFVASGDGPLGTHSVKKYATTHARRSGCNRDFVDYRARWKRWRRIQDVYVDTTLEFPDIKVACALCVGGPCKYKFVAGCGLSDSWVLENVVPNIAAQFDRGVAVVLGKAYLFAIFDPLLRHNVPRRKYEEVMNSYSALDDRIRLPVGTSPVVKVPIVMSHVEDQVYLDEIPQMVETDDEDGSTTGDEGEQERRGRRGQQELVALMAKMISLESNIQQLKDSFENHFTQIDCRLRHLENNTSRIALSPVRRITREDRGGGGRKQ